MADEHRRVEPRSIVGTGMMTDPERVEALQHDRERMERTWRAPPKKDFSEILDEAPPPHRDDDAAKSRRRRDEAEPEPEPEPELPEQRAVEEGEPASHEEPGHAEARPRIPPDPRVRKLHAMLEGAKGRKR